MELFSNEGILIISVARISETSNWTSTLLKKILIHRCVRVCMCVLPSNLNDRVIYVSTYFLKTRHISNEKKFICTLFESRNRETRAIWIVLHLYRTRTVSKWIHLQVNPPPFESNQTCTTLVNVFFYGFFVHVIVVRALHMYCLFI